MTLVGNSRSVSLPGSEESLFEFYCPTCLLSFEDDESLRAHYKSALHQYNTKRKILELPPVTPENFEKIKQSKPLANILGVEGSKVGLGSKARKLVDEYYCEVTKKKFKSQAAYENHLNSKKYKQELAKFKAEKEKLQSEPTLAPAEKSEKQTPSKSVLTTDKDQSVCLFSNVVSESIEENLKYMEKKFGFFIIDAKSCIDKQGLLKYLGELIHVQKKCISCDQIFKSGRDCQQHMIDRQHCFMDSDDFE